MNQNREKQIAEIIQVLQKLQEEKTTVIAAIDGRCASGKTTLAKVLQERLDCNVIHMDDFFLRPEQRTEERLLVPGENVDHERFFEEVLGPLRQGKEFSYRPYSCRRQELSDPVTVRLKKITVVEGAYSCHSALFESYDVRIFLSIPYEEQIKRLKIREGEAKTRMFAEKWIPLEEAYFSAYQIEKRCELCYL